jgi:Gly-Xaa carboxypeptidase
MYVQRPHSSSLKNDIAKVVPAGESTLAEWTYPPFLGHYDGEYIWGRGSEDDKSNLIAMLTVLECLLDCDFRPSRTIILSVGFDEEGGAEQSYGARCLAELLLGRYGNNGMELIVSMTPLFAATNIETGSSTKVFLALRNGSAPNLRYQPQLRRVISMLRSA